MFERLAHFILARRFLVAFVLGLIFFGLGGGGAKLTADFNVENFFQEGAHESYKRYHEQWGRDDAGIFIVVTGNQDSLLTPSQLKIISDLAEQLRADPNISRVVALSDFVRIRSEDNTLVFESIEDTVPADFDTNPQAQADWKKSLLEDPVLVPNLLSKTGKTGSILVELTGSTVEINALIPKLKGIRTTLSTFQGKEGLHFADSGMISLRADFFEAILSDQLSILPIASLLMLLIMGLTFRKFHGAIIPFLAAIVPTAMLFGIMGHRGHPIDMVNNTLTTLLPAIALADAIHLLSRFHEESRKLATPGEPLTKAQRKLAVAKSLKELGSACFLTSLTTAVGFGSLYLAEMRVLKSFGLYASLGIALSYGTVLFVMPLLLSFTKGQPATAKEDVKGEGHPSISRIADFSINRPILVLLITALITGIFVFYSTKVIVNNSLTNLLYDGHGVADSTTIVDQELGGIVSYEIDFNAQEPLFKNPKFLQALQDSEAWIKTNPDVRSVVSPATFISQSAESFTGESRIPDDPGLIAQLYLLLEGYEELEQVLDYNFKRARMAVRARDSGANTFGKFEIELRDHIAQAYKDFPVNVEITGAAVMAYRGVNNITYDLRRGLIGAFFIVALIIALEFKSIFMVLIALVANGIPLIIGYGSLGLFNWHLEPTTGLIFTVGLGIAVDDTIHLLARYFEEQKKGRPPDEALRVAVAQCGKAVFLTSCLLVVGLGMNLLSSFAYIRAVGASGSAIIIAALLCDLFTLPALLKLSAPFLPKIQGSGESPKPSGQPPL